MRVRALALAPVTALLVTGAAVAGAPGPQVAAPTDPRTAPLAVATAFLNAMTDGDAAKACSFISEENKAAAEARQGETCEDMMAAVQSAQVNKDRYRDWVESHPGVANVTVTGQSAFVSLPPNSVAVLVADADGAWTMQSLN